MGMKTARLTLTSARLPGLLLVIAAIAVLLIMPTAPTAQAAEVTLVSNLAETAIDTSSDIKNSHTVAQSFVTGSSDYTLGSVEVDISALPTATGGISVKIYSATSGGDPDSSLYTLSNPSSLSTGVNSFTAPDNTTLSASTTYFVVVANTAGANGFKVKLASSTAQTGETGWGIGDKRHIYQSGPSWRTFSNVAQIAVKGEAVTNNVSSGAPTISEAVALGGALTADTSGISDTDGKPSTAQGFQYQWFRGSTAITGATAPNYYPSDADVGQTLKVEVRFQDNLNFPEGPHASPATIAVPASTTVKVPWSATMTAAYHSGDDLTGFRDLGRVGSLSSVSFVIGGITYTVEGVYYNGADGQVKLLTSTQLPTGFMLLHDGETPLSSASADVSTTRADGKHIYGWAVTGGSPWSNSDKVAVAIRLDQSEATGKPTITGTTTVGATLTADKGDIADANGLSDPLDNLEYQWIRVDESTTPTTETDISGATSLTYVLQAADFGKKIKVKLTFNDRAGFEESRTSDATATIDVLTLHSDNGVPRGVWGNDDTIWVAEDDTGADNKIFAYNRSTFARDSSKDFDALDAAGNKDIQGIWSDGTTMFVVDYVDDKLYAYTVSTKARDSGKEITLSSFNDEPRGIWGNADTIWVAQDGTGTDNKIFAYRRSNGNRDSSKDFDTLDAAGNKDVEGLWSDGITMWVADSDDDKVYAYKMADESRDEDRDFDLISDNDDPRGMWSDGDTMYVVDSADDKLYLYRLPKPNATGAPSIQGILQDGETLAVDRSGIDDADGLTTALFNFQWARVDGDTRTNVGSDLPSYGLTADDVGKGIEVTVSFNDDNGASESLTSATTDAVLASNATTELVWLATLDIGESAGQVVGYSATDGDLRPAKFNVPARGDYTVSRLEWHAPSGVFYFDVRPAPPADLVEDWVVSAAGAVFPLADATEATLTGPAGTSFEIVPGLDNNLGDWADGESVTVALLDVFNSLPTGAPSIQGVLENGETLTADTVGISDDDGLDTAIFSYQWVRVDTDTDTETDIGTDLSTYTLTTDDVGKSIRVTVSYTDDGETAESLTSATTGAVVASDATRRLVWLATLDIGESATQGLGYTQTSGDLRPWRFLSIDSDVYTVARFEWHAPSGVFYFNVFPEPTADDIARWEVSVGGEVYPLSAATANTLTGPARTSFETDASASVALAGWTEGDSVTVLLQELRNLPATGAPTISGTATEGSVLTASAAGIADRDGLPTGAHNFSYQWVRIVGGNETDIPNATAPNYWLTADDVGKTIKVKVGFTDNRNNPEEPLASEATATVADAPTVNVFWSGTMVVGSDPNTANNFGYSAVSGTYSGDSLGPTTFEYGPTTYTVRLLHQHIGAERIEISPQVSTGLHGQWKMLIGGVEASLGAPVNNAGISNFPITGYNDAWTGDQHIAVGLKAVQANAAGAPSVTGTPEVGQSLSADTSAITDANGVPTDPQGFTYQWTADGVDIAGATAPDYWPSDADAGKVIRVKVSFEDLAEFDNGPLTSAPTAAVHRPATLSVPWSAAMTVGTYTDANNNAGFGWNAIFGFGAGSPSTFTIGGTVYTVRSVVHIPATKELFAHVVPALPDRFTLHYGAAGRNPSASAQRTYSPPPNERYTYTWTGVDAPDWAADGAVGHKVALAISTAVNVDATGAPVVRGPDTELLSAELMAGLSTNVVGYGGTGSYGSLDSTTFTLGGDTYTVGKIHVNTTGLLTLILDRQLSQDVRLSLDGSTFSSANAAYQVSGGGVSHIYDWSESGLSWSANDNIDVSLVLPGTVGGPPVIGGPLFADTAGISDENGKPDNAQDFTYQWQSQSGGTWADITGAAAPSYYPSDDDVGKAIRVQVSFEDNDGFDEAPLDSAATPVVPASTTLSVPWSGTVTMKSGAQFTGYSSARISSDGSLAPTTTLQVLGNTHTVEALRYDDTATDLELSLSPKFPLRFRLLNAALGEFNSAQATATDLSSPLDDVTRYLWDQTDPGWADGDRVAFAIRVNQNSDATGLAIDGAFSASQVLTANTSGITDGNGVTSPTYTYEWERVSCATASDDGVISGETGNTYTVLSTDLTCTIRVKVSFKDDDGYPESLNAAISARGGITNVEITSDPGADDTYAQGDWIEVSVTYSEAMTVTGTPRLELDIGGTPRQVDYHAASSTSTVLVFRYRVGTTDLDANGIAVSSSKLTLNGGGISTVATPVKDGSLFNPALAADSDHKVDGVAPTLVNANVTDAGQVLVLVLSEDIDGTVGSSDIAGRFTLRRSDDNSTVTFGNSVVSGVFISLSDLSVRIQKDWTLTLAYVDPSGNNANVVQDLAGNDLVDITGFSVNNGSTYVPNSDPTGFPTISGTVAVNEVLTVDTSTIADANGLGAFSYQWSRTGCTDPNDDGNISGATGVTYTVVAADLDCVLKVTVTYTDDDEYEESLFALTIDLSLANWTLSRNRSSVTEGGTVTVTLRITNGHTYSSAVTAAVYYGDTAVADGGLLAAQSGTHTITIPAGQNRGTVTLTARDDDLYNYQNGSTAVQLTARVGQQTLGSAVQLTVRDNEARPSITLSASSDRVIEGESITLTATAQPRYAGAMTVTLSHTDSRSVLAGAVPTTLEFAAESATAQATITTENDDTEKLNAQVTFTMSSPSAPGRLGSPRSVTLDWLDDDGPPLIGTPRDGLKRIKYLDEAVYGYRPGHGLRLYWWSVTGAVEYKLEYRKTDDDTGAWSRATVGDFDQSPSITDNRILMGVASGLECGTSYDVRLSVRGARPHYVDGFGPYAYLKDENGDRTTGTTGPCPKQEEITNVVRTAEPDCFTITWTRPTNTAWTGFRVARHILGPDNAEAVREVLHERVNDSSTRFRDCSNQHGNKYGMEGHSYIYDV